MLENVHQPAIERRRLAALLATLHAQFPGSYAKRDIALVAAAIHTIFAQLDRDAAEYQLVEVVMVIRNC